MAGVKSSRIGKMKNVAKKSVQHAVEVSKFDVTHFFGFAYGRTILRSFHHIYGIKLLLY